MNCVGSVGPYLFIDENSETQYNVFHTFPAEGSPPGRKEREYV